jgi:hypothetical protein
MIQTTSVANNDVDITQTGCVDKSAVDPHDLGRLRLFWMKEPFFVTSACFTYMFVKHDTVQSRKVKTGLLLRYLQNKQLHWKQSVLDHPYIDKYFQGSFKLNMNA